MQSSRLTQESTSQDDNQLYAKMDNAKGFVNLLKAISYKEHALCYFSPNGLKFTIEESKSAQANCFIPANMFQVYHFNHKDTCICFQINITSLLQCLQIFGCMSASTNTSLLMQYSDNKLLILTLQENDVVTDCKIITQDPFEVVDFDFTKDNIIAEIVIKAEGLKEVFGELDISSEHLQLEILTNPEKIKLSTQGLQLSCNFEIPKTSEAIEKFQVTSVTDDILYKYKISLIKPCFKALSSALKVQIMLDHKGVIKFQFMVKIDDRFGYVNYLCLPDISID